ncbi:UNVERIFIED_CONTAM: hypothetical protein HDU68_006374 [Siphonaria sp. JEL0065]|nr:hypothetical protein HDU68_006374 [Siphonaria sp. JEL0065]
MYASYDSDSSTDEFSVELVQDSPLMQYPPNAVKVNVAKVDVDYEFDHSRHRIQVFRCSAGFPSIQIEEIEAKDGKLVESVGIEPTLSLINSLLSSLNAVNSAHSNILSSFHSAVSDSQVLVDRVARLKRDVLLRDKDIVMLKDLRRKADSCHTAVLKQKTTEKELRTVKNHLLKLIEKMGCCPDGIKGFVDGWCKAVNLSVKEGEREGVAPTSCLRGVKGGASKVLVNVVDGGDERKDSKEWIGGLGLGLLGGESRSDTPVLGCGILVKERVDSVGVSRVHGDHAIAESQAQVEASAGDIFAKDEKILNGDNHVIEEGGDGRTPEEISKDLANSTFEQNLDAHVVCEKNSARVACHLVNSGAKAPPAPLLVTSAMISSGYTQSLVSTILDEDRSGDDEDEDEGGGDVTLVAKEEDL